MDKITIPYRGLDGKERTVECKPDDKGINLEEMGVATIDLSPLRFMRELRRLDLTSNSLTHLDLSPLSNCLKFESLVLPLNHLVEIDLAPLRALPELRDVFLEGNDLERLDLSPLRHCPKLRLLFFHCNYLDEVDITPVLQCPLEKFAYNPQSVHYDHSGRWVNPASVVLVADERYRDAKFWLSRVSQTLRERFDDIRWEKR